MTSLRPRKAVPVEGHRHLVNVPGAEEARPPDTMPEDDLPTTTRFVDATFVSKSFDLAELDGDS